MLPSPAALPPSAAALKQMETNGNKCFPALLRCRLAPQHRNKWKQMLPALPRCLPVPQHRNKWKQMLPSPAALPPSAAALKQTETNAAQNRRSPRNQLSFVMF